MIDSEHLVFMKQAQSHEAIVHGAMAFFKEMFCHICDELRAMGGHGLPEQEVRRRLSVLLVKSVTEHLDDCIWNCVGQFTHHSDGECVVVREDPGQNHILEQFLHEVVAHLPVSTVVKGAPRW